MYAIIATGGKQYKVSEVALKLLSTRLSASAATL